MTISARERAQLYAMTATAMRARADAHKYLQSEVQLQRVESMVHVTLGDLHGIVWLRDAGWEWVRPLGE